MSKPSREEFLARRKAGIGGSDIAAIAGLSPWRSPLDVYYDKVDPVIDFEDALPVGKTASLYWGTVMEDAIGKAYTKLTGRKICHYNRMLVHPDHPYFIGDVDFLAYCEDGSRPAKPKGEIITDLGIEIKTCRYPSEDWGEAGTDEVPMYYFCQCQWYMYLIPSIMRFDLVVLFGGSDMRIYTIRRDDAIIARLAEIGWQFWNNNVLPQLPPPPRSLDEVRMAFPTTTGRSMIASVELEQAVAEYATISAQRKAIEDREAEIKNKIAIAMADADLLTLPDETILVTFKEEKRGRVLRFRKSK